MPKSNIINRLVVCVDGTWTHADGTTGEGHGNNSNIYRLKACVKEGIVTEPNGRQVNQIPKYFHGIGASDRGFSRLKSGINGEGCENQIKAIIRLCSETLTSQDDELYLYGFSRGAYVVRAVAGFLHHMRLPQKMAPESFDNVYERGLELISAVRKDDKRKCGQIYDYLQSHTQARPVIKFVGVFDTVKYTNDKGLHDISFVDSIQNFRHALGLNEDRRFMSPEIVEFESSNSTSQRTLTQAWFLGAHADMGGASLHDGLSLYPLQWMLIESSISDLVLGFEPHPELARIIDDPLKLVFPTTWPLHAKRDNEDVWLIRFQDNFTIEMHDLRSTLRMAGLSCNAKGKERSHKPRINEHPQGLRHPRRAFGNDGLRGWKETGPFRTIVHPSVFLEMDLNPGTWDHTRVRGMRSEVGTFRETALVEKFELPWISSDTALFDTGVSAFRVLVCGKTGVGKSTLINRIFGIELTKESSDLSQGVHDIDQGLTFAKHPGLVIHDSKGYQAGSDDEVELIRKFLRKRASRSEPKEKLHAIWFCVESDTSRIEAADISIFTTVARYSADVPLFVVGTKKDKSFNNHFSPLVSKHFAQLGSHPDLGNLENLKSQAESEASKEHASLQQKLTNLPDYRSDGFIFLSKDDKQSIQDLLRNTLAFIDNPRVRLFVVAAQVVDLDQKIDSAVTECMRLGRHATRTAMVPLPFSGIIGTPTVARILCTNILTCFGFPNVEPHLVADIMQNIVFGNLAKFAATSAAYFLGVGGATTATTLFGGPAGIAVGALGCLLASPPTARMLLRCGCDVILILELAFTTNNRYVSETQIAKAAKYYVSVLVKRSGKVQTIQSKVHNEVDELTPLLKVGTPVGVIFGKLRAGMTEIIESNSCRSKDQQGLPKLSGDILRDSREALRKEIDSIETRQNFKAF